MLHTSIALRTLIDTAPVRAPTTHRRTVYAMSTCKAVVLNEGKLNFDKKVQLDALATVAEISKHEDTTTEQVNSTNALSPSRPLLMDPCDPSHVVDWPWCEQVLERVGDSDVLITKEMSVPAHIIEQLPASVRLICEAGTGASREGHKDSAESLACRESGCGIPCPLCAACT